MSHCGAINCQNNSRSHPELSFFRFPSNPERCRQWIQNCRREDLRSKTTTYVSKNVRLCSLHFENHCFMNLQAERKKLVWNAIPTLFCVPNPPKRDALTRPYAHHEERHASVDQARLRAQEEQRRKELESLNDRLLQERQVALDNFHKKREKRVQVNHLYL